jgi:putative endonuclease
LVGGRNGAVRYDRRLHHEKQAFGALYTGVTSDLVTRVSKHRAGEFEGFASKYKCKRLVWYELHGDMKVAIQRETSIKWYLGRRKIDLIEAMNPG